MAEKVNLDALIPRDDLEVTEVSASSRKKDSVSITDLSADSFFLMNFYKPDFQRETTEWDYMKISGCISSFRSGELIPSIILWQSKGSSIFIIDGAHRLSSLIAWANDDYGDGILSRKLHNGSIPFEQQIIAEKARHYINSSIGPYKDYHSAIQHPDLFDQNFVQKARSLTTVAIQLQWVVGDVRSAEKSFFNINQQGAQINPTEMALIESRRSPNCIAARAIMRKGQGHKYWARFPEEAQHEIEELADEIYTILFEPRLTTPIKTLDVPLCGKHSNSSLAIIFDFVNICYRGEMVVDTDGELTIECLKQTRKTARILNSNHASSLGLHPMIYFYAPNGSFRVSAFYAFALFVQELDIRRKFDFFIENRMAFEQFYYQNGELVQVITRKYRSAKKAMPKIVEFFFEALRLISRHIAPENILLELRKNQEYQYLPEKDMFLFEGNADKFSTEQKSEIYIREAMQKAPRCKICGGFVHRNSISIDHIERRQDGGNSIVSNGQITHPYCNTGYKN